MMNFSILIGKRQFATVTCGLLILGLAATAFAATGEGHHPDSGVLLKDFLFRVFNFTVTFGLLAYFVHKPIRRGLSARRDGIAKTLQQAESAGKEAEARFAEYDGKLTRAADEIEEIYAEIRREGELERERILANAKEMAEKIRLEAERAAASEIANARAELRREAARMAVQLAEDLLRQQVTVEDQERLMNEYMLKVGELH
ncbi:MAG: ATP synthase F0 subunit B [Desulfuromonadales bacterium]